MNNFKKFVEKIPLLKKSFTRFALSGASSFAIDVTLFQIFCFLFGKFVGNVSYVFFAGICARIFSALYNHAINYRFVFNGKRNYQQSATRYFLLAVVQGFCSSVLTTGLFNFVQCDLELFVKIPVDIFLFFISYTIQKKFVY